MCRETVLCQKITLIIFSVIFLINGVVQVIELRSILTSKSYYPEEILKKAKLLYGPAILLFLQAVIGILYAATKTRWLNWIIYLICVVLLVLYIVIIASKTEVKEGA